MSFKSLVELDSEVDSGDNEVEETNNFGSLANRYLIFQNSHATILLCCMPPDSLKEYTECVSHSS